MRYKPLILALLLSFSLPTYAAKDAPKEKAATVKKAAPVKKEKEAAKADVKKETSKKQAVKEKEEDKKAVKAKASKEKETADKNERASAKNKTAKSAEAAADNKKANRKAEEPKETAKDKKAAAAKSGKAKEQYKKPVEDKKDSKAKEPAKKAADDKKDGKKTKEPVTEDKKADAKEAKETANKAVEDKKDAKKNTKAKEQNKKAEPKVEPKAASSAENDFKTAVTAAANDMETKKSFAKRNEGFIIHVNATLKQLQQTRNNLSGINRKQRDAWEKFQKLNADANQLKAEVSNTRAQISRFVSGNYKNSQPNAVALFLKNADAGQKTRFLRYTRYINNANDQVMRDLEKQQKELAAQEQKINNELAYLKKLQANIQASLRQQGVTNTAEQAESRRQNAQMAKEAQKKINHRENEQRLNNLLKDLEKRKAEQRKAEAERARSEKAIADSKKEVEETRKLSTVDRMVSGGFEANKGRLPMPITGTYRIVSHFGQYNVEGLKNVKLDNKGINILGSSGCQARSIYDGEVSAVFGYGGSMVVMVRHGAYISVYANLRSASVTRGQRVSTRQTLGTVGADNILQFQLRKETAKLNPETWLGR